MLSLIRILVAVSLMVAGVSSAQAVIIAGDVNDPGGTGNTSAPSDDPGWSNVGALNGATCVYLGGGWVLTASHVGLGSPTFDDSSPYTPISSSYTTLYEPGKTSQPVDLAMFQLQTTPGLSGLVVSSTEPNSGSQVVAIGNGRNRAAGETYWDSNWNVVTQPDPLGYSGYYWGGGYQKRWGTNSLAHQVLAVDDGNGVTDTWETVFNDNGVGSEMEASTGDSGGGVFYKGSNGWELTGIMLAIGTYDGQPAGTPDSIDTAVFGNTTYFADLSVYHDEIDHIMGVPEPNTLVLVLTGGVAGWFFWRRRAAAR